MYFVYSYHIAMRALLEGRDNNPAQEESFNSLISGLNSLVTDLQNANKKWHRLDCSDERSDGHEMS